MEYSLKTFDLVWLTSYLMTLVLPEILPSFLEENYFLN